MRYTPRVLDETEHHADPRRTESEMPVDDFAKVPADERTEKPADIDAHVENGEARVPARVVLAVEPADDGGDIRFQKSHADDNQRQ